jgi:hypothetical protein
MTSRRFPPPWRADKIPGGYVVRDANGQALAYIYSRLQGTTTPMAGIYWDLGEPGTSGRGGRLA